MPVAFKTNWINSAVRYASPGRRRHLKVRAFKTNNTDSNVAAATYSLTSPLGGGTVAAGSSHTVLATPDGLVYGWGLNSSGQVGDSTFTQRTDLPRKTATAETRPKDLMMYSPTKFEVTGSQRWARDRQAR